MPFIRYANKNILFIHIPKTGGTTVESWMAEIAPLSFLCAGIPTFSKCTPQHYTWNDLKTLFPLGFFDYAFTIIRDPYARIESEYRMRWLLGQRGHFSNFPAFSLWLETQLDAATRNKWSLDNHLRPQVEFVGSPVKIFRFENGIDKILARVAAEAGLPPPTDAGHHLSTHDFQGALEWDLSDRLRVNTFYERDFDHLSYPITE